MTPEQIAVRAAALVLPKNARILGVRVVGTKCYVQAQGGLGQVVERAGGEMVPWAAFRADGFEVCTVHDEIQPCPPPPGYFIAVAVFEDGEALRLDDAASLRAFYRRAGGALEPVLLAHLLATNQAVGSAESGPTESGSAESVIVNAKDLDWLELKQDIVSIPGFVLPRWTQTTTEGRARLEDLEFCTYSLHMQGPRRCERARVSHWHVSGSNGDLVWEVRPLTSGLVSRLFEPG